MTMEVLADWVSRISNVVWNGLLLYLLVGTGIVFTIRTRFVQVRKFGAGWKHLFGHFSLNGEKAGKDGMSPFQALTTAIAAQVGTGNIAGAATLTPARVAPSAVPLHPGRSPEPHPLTVLIRVHRTPESFAPSASLVDFFLPASFVALWFYGIKFNISLHECQVFLPVGLHKLTSHEKK